MRWLPVLLAAALPAGCFGLLEPGCNDGCGPYYAGFTARVLFNGTLNATAATAALTDLGYSVTNNPYAFSLELTGDGPFPGSVVLRATPRGNPAVDGEPLPAGVWSYELTISHSEPREEPLSREALQAEAEAEFAGYHERVSREVDHLERALGVSARGPPEVSPLIMTVIA